MENCGQELKEFIYHGDKNKGNKVIPKLKLNNNLTLN